MAKEKSSAAENAQRKAKELLAEEKRKARTKNMLIVAVSLVLVAAVVIGAIVFIQKNQKPAYVGGVDGKPQNTTEAGAVVFGKDSAPVKVKLYSDFICPACQQFEASTGKVLEKLIDAGTIQVEYYPVAFMDHASRNSKYSTRASSAAYCVADKEPGKWLAFNHAMFANMPKQGTSGLRNRRIGEIAKEVGVELDVESCIAGDTFKPFVGNVSMKATEAGVGATPTLMINGEKFKQWGNVAAVEEHINKLATKE